MTIFSAILLLAGQQAGAAPLVQRDETRPASDAAAAAVRADEADPVTLLYGRPVLSRRNTRLNTKITPDKLRGVTSAEFAGENSDVRRYAGAADEPPSGDALFTPSEPRARPGRYGSSGEATPK